MPARANPSFTREAAIDKLETRMLQVILELADLQEQQSRSVVDSSTYGLDSPLPVHTPISTSTRSYYRQANSVHNTNDISSNGASVDGTARRAGLMHNSPSSLEIVYDTYNYDEEDDD